MTAGRSTCAAARAPTSARWPRTSARRSAAARTSRRCAAPARGALSLDGATTLEAARGDDRVRARCLPARRRQPARRWPRGAPRGRGRGALPERRAPPSAARGCSVCACVRTRTARLPRRRPHRRRRTDLHPIAQPHGGARPPDHENSHDPPDPQHRHHRPRRPWQDHARGPAPAPERHLPREREGRRARDGQQRPRARARHHDPREELRGRVEGHARQHRRHAGPRRLRRRGRTGAVDGRLGAAARRRGRRADAADALRDQEGTRPRPEADRRRQQGRPAGRALRLRHQRDLRTVRQAARDRGAARLPGRVRLRTERLGNLEAGRDRHRPGAAVRRDPRARAGARGLGDRPAAAADLLARLLELRRAHRHRPCQPGHPQADAERRGLQRPRRHVVHGPRQPGAEVRGPGAQAGHRGRPGRHRADQRHREHRHRRDADRRRQSRAAADAPGRRADADDELLRQQQPAGRPRRQVRHQPPDLGPPAARAAEQRRAQASRRPTRTAFSRSRGAANCT